MDNTGIQYKIRKYAHKLKRADNLDDAEMYQQKLRHYQSAFQMGGAELTDEEKAMMQGKRAEAVAALGSSPASGVTAQEAQAAQQQVEAAQAAQAAQAASTAASTEPAAPTTVPTTVPTTAPTSASTGALPTPAPTEGQATVDLDLSDAKTQFTETLEQYVNKFHNEPLDQMEVAAGLNLDELEESLKGLYTAIGSLKDVNAYNSDAAKSALGKISETAKKIDETAKKLREAQPDTGSLDDLTQQVKGESQGLGDYLTEQYNGLKDLLGELIAVEKTE